VSTVTFQFGGTDYADLFTVSSVTVPFLYRDNTAQPIGTNDGSRQMRARNTAGKIVISGSIIDQQGGKEISQIKDDMMHDLASKQLQVLTLSNYEGRYFNAIYDGEADYDLSNQRLSGVTITFAVPDGVAHSNDLTTVTGQSGTDITVSNAGTAPTAPVLTATMAGDNGVVAWTNDQGGVLQFGDPGEIDGVTTQAPEDALTVGFDSDPSGTANAGVSHYPNYLNQSDKPNLRAGYMGYGTDYQGSTAMAPVYSTKGDYWFGPSVSIPVPANKNGENTGNIVTYTRFYFNTDIKSSGRLEVTLAGDNKVVFESVIRDSTEVNDEIVWECWYDDQQLSMVKLDRKKFYNGPLYELRMWRFGSNVNFQLARVESVIASGAQVVTPLRQSFDVGNGEAIDSIQFWFERWKEAKPVTMGVTDFYAKWTNVNSWNDFANRFSIGDVVQADVATKTIYVNGVQDNTLHAIGNMWDSFWIQPGRNTIMPVASSWATPFDATVEYREAWL
jgi:predicted phage tail component-like protein